MFVFGVDVVACSYEFLAPHDPGVGVFCSGLGDFVADGEEGDGGGAEIGFLRLEFCDDLYGFFFVEQFPGGVFFVEERIGGKALSWSEFVVADVGFRRFVDLVRPFFLHVPEDQDVLGEEWVLLLLQGVFLIFYGTHPAGQHEHERPGSDAREVPLPFFCWVF